MTNEQMAAYLAAIQAAGITPERMGQLLVILNAYADVMIGDAKAAIADQQGAAAVQLAEAGRQAAQAEAAAARAAYLTLVQSMANGS